MVLVQRVRKNLNKNYHVNTIERVSFNSIGNDTVEEISRIYKDRKFTIRKPRFSQIGRPKKMVYEKPLIFVAYDGDTFDQVKYLKDRKIPANCIFFNDENEWRTEARGSCLKSDFYIPKKTLVAIIKGVIEQKRLIIKNKDDTEKIFKAFNEYRDIQDGEVKVNDVKSFDDLVLALAMPVWYYENLLSIRPRTA